MASVLVCVVPDPLPRPLKGSVVTMTLPHAAAQVEGVCLNERSHRRIMRIQRIGRLTIASVAPLCA